MINKTVLCDRCGKPVHGGAYIDLTAHNAYDVVVATYPPQHTNLKDLCEDCTRELREWLKGEDVEQAHDATAAASRHLTITCNARDIERQVVVRNLQGLTFEGEDNHGNLSRVAYAIYPCPTGWTAESVRGLRDRLVHLLDDLRIEGA